MNEIQRAIDRIETLLELARESSSGNNDFPIGYMQGLKVSLQILEDINGEKV